MCYDVTMKNATTFKEPPFTPEPGQVDYSHIRYCPVINCVLQYDGKILVIQRNKNMRFYPGFWNGLSGFLDDHKSIEEKVYEEIKEETGLSANDVLSITRGQVLVQEEPEYGKTWLIFPVRVLVKHKAIKLDWEADSHKWVSLEEAKQLELLPGFSEVLQALFG